VEPAGEETDGASFNGTTAPKAADELVIKNSRRVDLSEFVIGPLQLPAGLAYFAIYRLIKRES
jgi:hypothetical protein